MKKTAVVVCGAGLGVAAILAACVGAPAAVTSNEDAGHANDAATKPMDGASPQDATMQDAPNVPLDAGLDVQSIAIDAGVDAGFKVSAVPGLALWLAADQGIAQDGGLVTMWTDQSSNANNAAPPTATQTPVYVASDINSKPALRFGAQFPDAASSAPLPHAVLSVNDSPSLQFGSGDFLIENVLLVKGGEVGLVWEKQTIASPFSGIGMFINWPQNDAGTWAVQYDATHVLLSPTQSLDMGTWHIYGLQRSGSTLAIRVDGLVNSSINLSTQWADGGDAAVINTTAPGETLSIGAQYETGAFRFQTAVDIAEVIAVNGVLGATDLANIEGYLSTKYGIAIH